MGCYPYGKDEVRCRICELADFGKKELKNVEEIPGMPFV